MYDLMTCQEYWHFAGNRDNIRLTSVSGEGSTHAAFTSSAEGGLGSPSAIVLSRKTHQNTQEYCTANTCQLMAFTLEIRAEGDFGETFASRAQQYSLILHL